MICFLIERLEYQKAYAKAIKSNEIYILEWIRKDINGRKYIFLFEPVDLVLTSLLGFVRCLVDALDKILASFLRF